MGTTNKKTLGRGIDALLSSSASASIQKTTEKNTLDNTRNIVEIELNQIKPNPFQPRIVFNKEKLSELSESIKNYGILEPILVTKNNDNTYNIIAGERRYKASKKADLKKIPCIILSLNDEEKLEIAIIENLQRENLNPIEMATSFKDIMNLSKITQDELAKKLSVSRPVVSNLIRLLSLPEYIQEAIQNNSITQSHARLLLSIEDETKQNMIFNQILNNKLSVKTLEKQINKNKNPTPSNSNNNKTDKTIRTYEQKLIEFFGTKVSIKGNIKKGSISIEYYNQEDFSRILDIINISLD